MVVELFLPLFSEAFSFWMKATAHNHCSLFLAAQVGVFAPHDDVWHLHCHHEVSQNVFMKKWRRPVGPVFCVFWWISTLCERSQVQLPDPGVCDASVQKRQAVLPQSRGAQRRQGGRRRRCLQHLSGAPQQRCFGRLGQWQDQCRVHWTDCQGSTVPTLASFMIFIWSKRKILPINT